MAKNTKTSKKAAKGNHPIDPLEPGRAALARGDYPGARASFRQAESDPALSLSEQEMAQEYRAATGLERGALLTVLGCLVFYGLLIAFAVAKQP